MMTEDKKLSNYNYCLEVGEFKKNIELMFLELGKALLNIRDNFLFEESWESFEDYLDEIKISPSVASRLIKVYSTLVLNYKIEPNLIANAGGWSNAYEIIKLSPTKDDAIEWLKDSENRLPKDTKIALREAKSGVKIEDCDHDYYLLKICRKCGDKERLYEE